MGATRGAYPVKLQKLLMLLRAKPGLTRAQALEHLKERHGPLVRASTTLRRRVKRYLQHHVIDAPSVGQLTCERDWIVESWVDPEVVLPEPPTAADAILVREDEQRFPDHASLVVLEVEPRHRFGSEGIFCPLQLFLFVNGDHFRDVGLSREARVRLQPHVLWYERNVVVRSLTRTQPKYGTLDVVGFVDEARVRDFFADGELQLALSEGGGAFVQQWATSRLLARTHVVFDFEQ